MILGIVFIAIGILIYVKETYNIDVVEGERVFSKKDIDEKNFAYKYKILICVFSFLVGVYSIINSIIY